MPMSLRRTASPSPAEVEALEDLPVAILQVDADGRIEASNKAARSLLPDGEPIARALSDLFLHESEALAAAQQLSSESGAPRRVTMPDGRRLDVHARARAGGGVSLALHDVSAYAREADLAARDPLTGLWNRAGLRERLDEALARARRTGGAIAVLCVDLDRFKAVNDTLGHPTGDALLVKVAERLRSASRDSDIVARLGGDEFAIVQAETPQPQGAETLAARLVDLIGRTYVVGGHMLNIGASIGVAVSPSDGEDADALLKHGDLALYRAKSDGRGVFRFFEPGMDAEMQARRLLEIDLRRALALKEFRLVYQPQVQLEPDAITGFEALLRWGHPTRGEVSPADFIPLAEEIGLITPIGEWVLRTACAEAASWSRPASIAVNLSPVQFRGAKLVETVTSVLAHTGLDPTRLELEITESALLENTDTVLRVLKGLRAMGVRISMDDFGTGYSSLSYLQKFPFDKIKIDQSFVRDMGDGGESHAIVRAVAGLGASLGMRTVAEGVETPEQLARMRREGCSDVQGYLTGRPIAPDAIAALLAPPPPETAS